MAQLPASYPSIPYLGAIPGGLYHGLMIRINGEMNHHDRFVFKDYFTKTMTDVKWLRNCELCVLNWGESYAK